MAKKTATDKWRKRRREEYLELKKYRYYIFCEGQQTEPKYFAGFKKCIEENHINRGQIWCVYDKDSFPAEHFNQVEERAFNLNKQNPELQYHAAWSNECIEFWFLLHFAFYTSNNHRTKYISFLNEKFKALGIAKYQKNMDDIFVVLLRKGNPKLAIRYAKQIIKESQGKTPTDIAPGTKVYQLVEELAKYMPEELKKRFI